MEHINKDIGVFHLGVYEPCTLLDREQEGRVRWIGKVEANDLSLHSETECHKKLKVHDRIEGNMKAKPCLE